MHVHEHVHVFGGLVTSFSNLCASANTSQDQNKRIISINAHIKLNAKPLQDLTLISNERTSFPLT